MTPKPCPNHSELSHTPMSRWCLELDPLRLLPLPNWHGRLLHLLIPPMGNEHRRLRSHSTTPKQRGATPLAVLDRHASELHAALKALQLIIAAHGVQEIPHIVPDLIDGLVSGLFQLTITLRLQVLADLGLQGLNRVLKRMLNLIS